MDYNGIVTYTDIKELNTVIQRTIYANIGLRRIFAVEAELSNYVIRGNNIFFTLKDASGVTLPCFMRDFRKCNVSVGQFKDGDKVVVKGNIDVWTNRGEYRFIAVSIDLGGEGAMLAKLKELKLRLTAEGLFDPAHKKKLPAYPRYIGLVTSYDRDAYHDVVDNTFEKNPYIKFTVMDTMMQGSSAVSSVVKSIKTLDKLGLDMIVIARGGGGAEERWTFNDEAIVRAIYDAKTPIITAIGHTLNGDHLADLVADVSAVVPNAVAERFIPDIEDVFEELYYYLSEYRSSVNRKVDRLNLLLDNYLQKLHSKSPSNILKENKHTLGYLEEKLISSMNNRMVYTNNRLENLIVKLNGLSPTAKLVNGFGYVSVKDEALKSVKEVSAGDRITVTISDGNINAVVDSVEQKDNTI